MADAEAKALEEAEQEEDGTEGEAETEESKKDEAANEAPIVKAKAEKEEKAKAPATKEGPSTRKKLSSFDISAKNIELLNGAKISTVNQFIKALEDGDSAILDINGIGPKGLEDMKKLLKDEGYSLP